MLKVYLKIVCKIKFGCKLEEVTVVTSYSYNFPWVSGVRSLIYLNLDDYSQYSKNPMSPFIRHEKALLQNSRYILCLSAYQTCRFRFQVPKRASFIHHFPLGVKEEFVNVKKITASKSRSVGYIGNLGERVDWKLVYVVAKELSNIQFEFVGHSELSYDEDDPGWRGDRNRVAMLRNVTFKGAVSQENVKDVYRDYCVNWMPYVQDNLFNIASCPTKIFDAVASGRPFISCYLPELNLHKEFIPIFHTPKECIDLLSFYVSKFDPNPKKFLLDYASKNTWQERARQFIYLLEGESI